MKTSAWMIAVTLIAATPAVAQVTPGDSLRSPGDFSAAIPVIATPPDFPRGKISGYLFGDYYYNVSGDAAHRYNAAGADSAKTNIDNSASQQIGRDLNGVQIRRVYFQLDNDLSVEYATRVRLEVDGKSLTSDGKLGVNVKAAYALARGVVPHGDFYIGLLSAPVWDGSEEFWQYRSIEKTLADFRGIGTATDIGAELKGFFDSDHRVGYAAMIGDGQGQKPEDNRYKKFYLSLPTHVGDLRVEPYVDYENAATAHDRATYKVFAGYEFERAAVGIEALDRVNHVPGANNQEPAGLSIFARATRAPLAAFVRVDFWKSDRRNPNRVDSQLWIAGLDWQPIKDVHFMPNIEATQYDAKGTAVAPAHHDLQARLTFYYRFSRPQS